jgi:hypothetical protein
MVDIANYYPIDQDFQDTKPPRPVHTHKAKVKKEEPFSCTKESHMEINT